MNAGRLRALHVPGSPLVLPNAWDADSARLVESAGFPVVATSSAAVAASLGYSDGEAAPIAEMFAAASRIAQAVSVPVTVDAEGGYGLPAAELVGRLHDAGVVGCNLEDSDHGTGRLVETARQADRLASVRQAAGGSLVINARIDVFLGAADENAVLPQAIERARGYLAAGVDCVYPITLRSPDVVAKFTAEVNPAAVNVTYLPNGPDVAGLAQLGVARISLGAGLWSVARSYLERKLSALAEGTMPY